MKFLGLTCTMMLLNGCYSIGAKVLAEGPSDAGSTGGSNSSGFPSTGGASGNTPSAGGLPLLSEGNSNAISTSGYWWTFRDHLDVSGHPGEGATIAPMTDMVTALIPDVDQSVEHGQTIHVTGRVPPAPSWANVSTGMYTDLYWRAQYPDSLIAAYPTAAVGFDFQRNGVPFDVTQGSKYIGVVFDMKTAQGTNDIQVQLATVGTLLPDKTFADQFPAQCVYPHAPFLDTYLSQTCFANRQKVLATPMRAGDNQWQTYCVLWSEMHEPAWASPTAVLPPWGLSTLRNSIQLIWNMFQPAAGEPAVFDVRLDNVKLVTAADAQLTPNNCDLSQIGPSQQLIQGL